MTVAKVNLIKHILEEKKQLHNLFFLSLLLPSLTLIFKIHFSTNHSHLYIEAQLLSNWHYYKVCFFSFQTPTLG